MMSSSVLRVQEAINELRERHDRLRQEAMLSPVQQSKALDADRAKLRSDVKEVIAAIGDATELLADIEDI